MPERVPPRLTAAFLALECAIYAVFLTLDLTGGNGWTVPIKYAGVLLCLAYALLCARRGGDRLVPLALLFTAGADWFLLVRNDHYAVGVVLFLCVQTVYFIRLRLAGAGIGCVLRIGLALIAALAVYAAGMAAPINLLAALYFSQLLSNTALAWTLTGKRWRYFALGLTLFVGCDACVGLFNTLPAASPVYPIVTVGMWFFYLPSQILIALSARPEKEVRP